MAAGSWSRGEYSDKHDIYIYDWQSQEIQHVIRDLPSVLLHLKFSPDGKYLAATMGAAKGLRIYETGNWQQIAKDRGYGGTSCWVDFDREGRLVTSCLDGYIRLYDKGLKLIRKKPAPGGKNPYSVVFSSDSRHIAIGYLNSSRVDVLSADNLKFLFSADTSGKWRPLSNRMVAGWTLPLRDRSVQR